MSAALLELRDLRVRYGPVEAVRGIHLEVREGELIALLGANGAGKTSVLNAISGLCAQASGKVLWQGIDMLGRPAESIFAAGLVQVPEGRGIFLSLSVRDNLMLALDARGPSGADGKRAFDEVLAVFPRVAERLAQRAGELSGGELQMVALARALLCRPRLLMLDEPSMGLAPILVQQTFELLARIHAEGTSLLLVEQNARQALAIADRAYVLETGNLTLSGPATVLAQDPRVVSAYLGG
ncbi:MAG: ABC transporter ATP-binding protein [Pseudomonadota bacterium]|nr:ABC transporter ATP-binding protein [Pseudomonadota bacterium]